MDNSGVLKLGNIELDVPFFQASLSGYSDYAMRSLARRFGCPFTIADMMLAKSAANPRVLRKAIFRPGDDEHPIGAQIIGRIPDTMANAARDLAAAGYDAIDLNFACPSPKVLRRGRGGAMLNEPDTVIDIIKAVRDAVACPVLIKLRIGVNHKPQSRDNFREIVTRSVEHGVDALVIHGRTVSERFRGCADWDIPIEVKRHFPDTTIIGSGDVFDATDAIELLKKTGLDGLLVARGAVGNPWIFRDLRCLWENRPLPSSPDMAQQRLVMLEHFRQMLRIYPEKKAVGNFRKFAVRYVRRHPKRKQALLSMMAAKTSSELEAAINTWYAHDPLD